MDKYRIKTTIIGGLLFLTCLILGLMGSISHSINYLHSIDVSTNLVYLLLILPFLGLFISFSKIIVGISTPNSLIPLAIVLCSFFLGPLQSCLILLLILFSGYIIRYLIFDFKLHFAVKQSLILSFLSIVFIILLPFLPGVSDKVLGFYPILIFFGILLIPLVNDKYLSFKLNKPNLITDLKIIINTIVFSLIAFLFLGGQFDIMGQNYSFPYLKSLIETFPETVLAATLLTALIGRYTGLRLAEIFRFRKLLFKSN